VPGHDQSTRRVRDRIRFGLILATATAASAVAPAARGQSAGAVLPAAPRTRETIDLAATLVRVWEEGGSRWILLSGRAAVLQGLEGVRADEVVVRLRSTPAPGGTRYWLDLYAEGAAALDGRSVGGRGLRTQLQTEGELRLRAYEGRNLIRLDGPPKGASPLTRSGLWPPAPPAAPRPAPAAGNRVASRPVLVPTSIVTPTPPASADPPATTITVASATAGTAAPPPGPVEPAPDAPAFTAPPAAEAAKVDPAVKPAQFPDGDAGTDDPTGNRDNQMPPPAEAGDAPTDLMPTQPPFPGGPRGDPSAPGTTTISPLPRAGDGRGEGDGAVFPPDRPGNRAGAGPGAAASPRGDEPALPFLAGSQRVTMIYPRNGGDQFNVQSLGVIDGRQTVRYVGGVNIVTDSPQTGTVDIVADSVILWRRVTPDGKPVVVGPNGEQIEDPGQPLEFYLEGHVILRQDERKAAGKSDQREYTADAAYYDVISERFLAVNAQVSLFAPGLVTPAKFKSPKIEQFRPLQRGPDGKFTFGLAEIRADQTVATGSRFPNPGYRFNSQSIDMFRVKSKATEPNSGTSVGPADGGDNLTWQIDARQNVYYAGPVPIFYWPRVFATADDLEPPLRMLTFRTNNYFGQQLLADFNGFRLFGLRKPKNIDIWNLDLDYLSQRTQQFPALGSEIGWFGNDLINDLRDPYGEIKGKAPTITNDYFGYFDIWGLRDNGRDVLGSGPAIITNNRRFGNVGFQRGGGGRLGSVPAFEPFRGKVTGRHMQRFLPDDQEHLYQDFRAQLEIGFTSDRYFLEEYYKRLFDTGLDQETDLYVIRQKENKAFSVLTSANLQSWVTENQYFPRLDYYQLGGGFFDNRVQYFTHTGVDYSNTHTATEVNNPYIFAYMPYDPISNTSGPLLTGRGYTNHEFDVPLNLLDNRLRIVPYVQGQAEGWTNQINGSPLGRVWGAGGIRAEVMAWKVYPQVQSELFNVHGINHKISLMGDYRDAFSNLPLNRIGVTDNLDDNTYESTRRYLALTNYSGGILPPQYDPRHLILRRTLSPITGPTDIQSSIDTLHFGIHQRLQTKRGPEGRRRIIDWMTLDLDSTYFPQASRDNFGKPFGQNMYNWQWFLGDRASILSYGWFEFWDITGNPIYKTNINRHNDPFGLNVITTGISINRPPRGQIFLGYTVINTGPINTSALTTQVSYWMSPKYYGTFSNMYDFGNAILLNSAFTVTRIGADYLTSVGLTVDPQRSVGGIPSFMFAFQISPRLSPNARLGSGVGVNNLDSRYAPTE